MFGKSKIRKSLALWKYQEALIRSNDRLDWVSYNCRRLHLVHIHSKLHDSIVIADSAEDMVVSAYRRIRKHELADIRKKRAEGKKITRRDRIALMSARWYLDWARERIEEAKSC